MRIAFESCHSTFGIAPPDEPLSRRGGGQLEPIHSEYYWHIVRIRYTYSLITSDYLKLAPVRGTFLSDRNDHLNDHLDLASGSRPFLSDDIDHLMIISDSELQNAVFMGRCERTLLAPRISDCPPGPTLGGQLLRYHAASSIAPPIRNPKLETGNSKLLALKLAPLARYKLLPEPTYRSRRYTMHEQSRREFLVRSAALSAAALSFRKLAWGQPSPGAEKAPPSGADRPLDMTIVRFKGEMSPADASGDKSPAARLTEKAIAELGGMQRFVKKGDVVWIKPNIGWNRSPEQAANTHPEMVAALIRLCLAAGAKKVKVGDYPCNDAKQSYENSGIAAATKAAGAEVVYLDKSRFRDMKIGGNLLKDHPVYPEIVECDLVINVPIVKHHSATKITAGMKNYMGVVDKRQTFHQDLPTTIADMTQFMKPRLCVLDATRILTAHGPTGGDLEDVKALNTVAAGVDIVALDALAAELLGHKPADIGTVAAGQKYGLGKIDYRSLALKEFELS